jgi:opacity protein-like surface antigen
MPKFLVVSVAILLSSIAGPVLAADLPVVPVVAAVPVFSWTSCYLGGHVGGGWSNESITDPVLLVQDTVIGPGTTVGSTTAKVNLNGLLVGGQGGCDYQFAPNWVVGVEGDASGSNLKGSKSVGLPAGFPGEQAVVTSTTDFIPSVTARVGYALDRLLLYGKGGVAWATDKVTVNGMLTGVGFGFQGMDVRTGLTAGVGAEWVFSPHWSAVVEYDYYSFGNGNIFMSDANSGNTGFLSLKQTAQVVKAGLNFHVWAW